MQPIAHAQMVATYQLLHVAQQDLSQAAFFADHLRQQGWHAEPWEGSWQDYLHQGAYMTAMVVAYARPFTGSRGWPKFPARLLRLDAEQKLLHERLLQLRNELYAHSDVAARRARPIMFKGKPNAIEALPPMRMSATELLAVRKLILTISQGVNARLEELSRDVGEQTSIKK